jgi:hypothetical protein
MNELKQQTWVSHKKNGFGPIPSCLLHMNVVTKGIQNIIDGHKISQEDEKKILLRIR